MCYYTSNNMKIDLFSGVRPSGTSSLHNTDARDHDPCVCSNPCPCSRTAFAADRVLNFELYLDVQHHQYDRRRLHCLLRVAPLPIGRDFVPDYKAHHIFYNTTAFLIFFDSTQVVLQQHLRNPANMTRAQQTVSIALLVSSVRFCPNIFSRRGRRNMQGLQWTNT